MSDMNHHGSGTAGPTVAIMACRPAGWGAPSLRGGVPFPGSGQLRLPESGDFRYVTDPDRPLGTAGTCTEGPCRAIRLVEVSRMNEPKGHVVPISGPRRFIIDLIHFAHQVPSVPVSRSMDVSPLFGARAEHPAHPSWSIL